MRTTASATTAPWRKTSTQPLEVEDRPTVDAQTQALLAEEKETIILMAKYDPRGPECHTLFMHLCSRAPLEARLAAREVVFGVTELIKGDLPARVVAVSPWRSGVTFVPPKELKLGTVYTLRLTPSAESREYLREQQERDGWYHLRAGDRLEVVEPELQ